MINDGLDCTESRSESRDGNDLMIIIGRRVQAGRLSFWASGYGYTRYEILIILDRRLNKGLPGFATPLYDDKYLGVLAHQISISPQAMQGGDQWYQANAVCKLYMTLDILILRLLPRACIFRSGFNMTLRLILRTFLHSTIHTLLLRKFLPGFWIDALPL